MEFSKLQWVSLMFTLLATIFMIIGVSTNYWNQTVDSKKVVQTSLGLWKSCTYNEQGDASCVSWGSIKNTANGVLVEWADWIYVQKTFALMSIILGVVVVCAFAVYKFSGGKGARIIQAGLVLASTTSFLAFGIFVIHMPVSPPSLVRGYSFILFTTGACMVVVATMISLRQICMPEKDRMRGIPRKV